MKKLVMVKWMFSNYMRTVIITCLYEVGLEWVKTQHEGHRIIEKDNIFIVDGIKDYFYTYEINKQHGMGELVKYVSYDCNR